MTTLTDTQVITASGGLVELGYRQITSQTTVTATTSTPGTTIIPSFSVVCDGSPVLVEFSSPYINVPTSANMRLWLQIDGANYQMGILSPTTFAPTQLSFRVTPTAGSHTFALIAWADVSGGFVGAGPGLAATDYVPAFLRVSKIVQATQWPAVTTGTTICTSSTRPASPFEGQQIWETDTDKFLVYNGSAWYPPWNQPWGRLASATSTAGTFGTTFGTVHTQLDCGTVPANRKILVRANNTLVNTGSATNVSFGVQRIEAGATTNADTLAGVPVGASAYNCCTFQYEFTSVAGTLKVQLRAKKFDAGATVTYDASGIGVTHLVTVEDIGPA